MFEPTWLRLLPQEHGLNSTSMNNLQLSGAVGRSLQVLLLPYSFTNASCAQEQMVKLCFKNIEQREWKRVKGPNIVLWLQW